MKAVQLSHDRQKLRAVAQEYARDHNLTLPPGMQNNRGKDRFPDHAKTENLAEKQQEERTGTSKKQRMDEITKAWRESSDGRSFVKALEASGYLLARGDQRSYVVVDLYGEVHSLSRQLDGVKSKDLKARLADYSLDKLPDGRRRAGPRAQTAAGSPASGQQQDRARQEASRAERAAEMQATAGQRRDALQKAQALRRAELDAKRQKLAERHSAERKALADLQSARSADIARDRAAKQPKGVLAFLGRITGYQRPHRLPPFPAGQENAIRNTACKRPPSPAVMRAKWKTSSIRSAVSPLSKNASAAPSKRVCAATCSAKSPLRRKLTPAKELTPAQQAKAEKARELADAFRKSAAAPQRRAAKDASALTPEQQAKLAEFRKTAQDIAAPAAKQQRGQETARPPKSAETTQTDKDLPSAPAGGSKALLESFSQKFKEAVLGKPAPPPDSLAAKFKEAAQKPGAKTEKTAGKKQAAPPRETPPAETAGGARLRDLKENAADMTAAQRRALDLAKAFKERAGPTRREKDHDQEGRDRGDSGRKEHYRKPPPDFSFRR